MCSMPTKPRKPKIWNPGNRQLNMKYVEGKSQNDHQGESQDHSCAGGLENTSPDPTGPEQDSQASDESESAFTVGTYFEGVYTTG